MSASYYVTDHWTGEDYGNASVHPNYRENPIVTGSWKPVTAVTLTAHAYNGRLSGVEYAAAVAKSRYSEPDSDAPDMELTGTYAGQATSSIDALSVLANQQQGLAKAMHHDMYALQRNDAGSYRAIILVQMRSDPSAQYYASHRGYIPAISGRTMQP